MSCGRAREVDLAAYLIDRRAAEWTDFRTHYPRCPDCSRALADWLGFKARLEAVGEMPGASHPSEAQLLAFHQDPAACAAQERAAIEAHLAQCRECRSELAVLRGFDFRKLTPLPVARSPGGVAPLWEALLAALRRPALAFALLLGLVVSGMLAIPWFGGRQASPPQSLPVAEVEERAPAPAPVAEEPEPQIAREETLPMAPEVVPAPPEPRAELPESPAPREAAPADKPLQIAALVPAEAPVYRPDAALAGGSLASERSAPVIRAGLASGLPEIRALGPEHVGATTSAAPTLYWFLSGASSVPVEITLTSERAAEPLLEMRLEPPVGAGLHALRLERRGVSIEPGATYHWFVALVPDPAHRDTDLVSGAALRRAVAAGALTEQLAAAGPAERAHVLAAAGYWYDAFDTLTRWIQAEPAAERLREHRAALLEQVGLAGVAGLLSAPAGSSQPAADQ